MEPFHVKGEKLAWEQEAYKRQVERKKMPGKRRGFWHTRFTGRHSAGFKQEKANPSSHNSLKLSHLKGGKWGSQINIYI